MRLQLFEYFVAQISSAIRDRTPAPGAAISHVDRPNREICMPDLPA